MAKNYLEMLGRLALLRGKEDPKGTPQTSGGATINLDSGSAMGLNRQVEHNGETVHGSELPTEVFMGTQSAEGTLTQSKVKPDFLGFVLAFFAGSCSSTTTGTSTSPQAYEHTIAPLTDDVDHPSFTLIQQRGDAIVKERYSGNSIDEFTLELGEGWVSLSAGVKGLGKRDINYHHEIVSAAENSTQLTLAANAVEGADAAARLENVFRVRAKAVGQNDWTVLSVTGVSAATPAVLSLETAVGTNTSDINFHLDYIPEEPAWCTLPAAIDESPLKVQDLKIVVDAHFDGTFPPTGGRTIASDVEGFSVSGVNNLRIKPVPDSSGVHYSGESIREGRQITIKLSEKLKNSIRLYQADNPEAETLSVWVKLKGAEINSGEGVYFGADIFFPKCAILAAPITVGSKILAVEGDMIVLDDGTYNGMSANVYNCQTGYCQ